MKRLNQHILLIAILSCLLFCAGCSPIPIVIENKTEETIGVILAKRERPTFEVPFEKHEYISPGESKRCHAFEARYIKLYSKDGFIGIWPADHGDRFIIKKNQVNKKFEVTHDISGRDYGAFPIDTYAYMRTPERFAFYLIWMFSMSVLWLIPLALFTLIDRLIRKERSFANKLIRNFNKLIIALPLFFVAAIASSYLITRAGALEEIRKEHIFIEKIRTLEDIDSKLLKEKELSFCNHGQQKN